MKLSDLGERKVVDILTKKYGKDKGKNVIVGIGDDACVLDLNEKEHLVISTDIVFEKTHIPREMTPRQVGKYVVNINLSDIASMGAQPLGLLFSLGLPRDLDDDFIHELSEGINDAAKEHEVPILGGDTKEHGEMVISGTALGRVSKDGLLTRSGAEVGDLVCVTGTIGLSAAGFYAMVKDLELDKSVKERIMKAALEPKARVREGIILGKYATSCIDISDGLAYSLYEISKMSDVGALIQESKIPVEEEVKMVSKLANIDLREIVIHKGGDYELLFTLPLEKYTEMEEKIGRIGTKVTVIGEVTKGGLKVLSSSNETIDLEPRGYESFVTEF